jgi:enoyl-CoA hydratase/carnithine racemase
MSYEAIKYEKSESYGVITLNRPERLNAIGKQMVTEILQVIDDISSSNSINALIITGAPRPDGRPCFCAGADLKDIMEKGFLPQLPLQAAMQAIASGDRKGDGAFWEIVARCPKITIAAIDGVCSAGGLELALVCDIIVASETAQIGDLHMKNMGGIGGAAVTVNLSRRVGVARAIEMVATSEFIDGREAHRINLANHVYSPVKMMEGARELAKKIGGMRPDATALVKSACNAIYNMDYRTAWRYADACSAALGAAPKSVAPTVKEPPKKGLILADDSFDFLAGA